MVAQPVRNPAISVLKGGHLGAAQTAGNQFGARKACRVIAVGDQQRGQIICQKRHVAVAGIKRLVDGDGPVDIAVSFQQARAAQIKRRAVRQGGNGLVQHASSPRRIALAQAQLEKRGPDPFVLGVCFQKALVDLRGLIKCVRSHQNGSPQKLQIKVLWGGL